ncbi:hypothetical protein LTR36_002850 [Oleoguttula mirabilis]|uniref:Uncharacterized protein n=1 Tax=Oleoguttula mirabilis TaxID=1507867 RepID=A0AAV9JJS1_9PEZI|nr:hypothetical protein LTR36_002850 [Oleoguttula mirabilis]
MTGTKRARSQSPAGSPPPKRQNMQAYNLPDEMTRMPVRERRNQPSTASSVSDLEEGEVARERISTERNETQRGSTRHHVPCQKRGCALCPFVRSAYHPLDARLRNEHVLHRAAAFQRPPITTKLKPNRLSEHDRDEAAAAWKRTPSQAAAYRRRAKAVQLAETLAKGLATECATDATKKLAEEAAGKSAERAHAKLVDELNAHSGFDWVVEQEMRWLCEQVGDDWRAGPEVPVGSWMFFIGGDTRRQGGTTSSTREMEKPAVEAKPVYQGRNVVWDGREIPSRREMERPAFGSGELSADLWADAKCRLWSSPYAKQLSPWGKLLEGHIVFAELREAQKTEPQANMRSALSGLEDQKRQWAKSTGLGYVGFGHDSLYSRG